MAKRPTTVRDTLSCISKKIEAVAEVISYFGYEALFDYPVFEIDSDSAGVYLRFKLHILILYSLYKELGCSKVVLDDFKNNADDCISIDDIYCANDSCTDVSWIVAPFWKVKVHSNYHLYGKDDNPDRVEEAMIQATLNRFSDIFLECGYSTEVIDVVRTSDELYRIAAAEYYYSEEVEASFYFVRSELLPHYYAYVKSLDVCERRAFQRRKLVKELNRLLDECLDKLHPNLNYSSKTELMDGFFLFAAADDCCNCFSTLVPGSVNFMAGLYASLLDLHIFALDEEYHFLPREYAGRSSELFPNFVSKRRIEKVS